MTVFVTDGAERTNLVHVGESYRFSTTALSKYSKRSFIYPYHPQKKGLEIGEERKIFCGIPMGVLERFWL